MRQGLPATQGHGFGGVLAKSGLFIVHTALLTPQHPNVCLILIGTYRIQQLRITFLDN